MPLIVASDGNDATGRSNRSIPEDQVDEVRELSETMTDDEIAERFYVSRDTVIRFRKKHGIEKTSGPREGKTRWDYQWEPWQKQKLIEMKLAGRSYGEIAEAVGKTRSQCSGMWFWEKKKLDKAAEEDTTERPDEEGDTAQPDVSGSESPAVDDEEAKDDEVEAQEDANSRETDLASRRITVKHPGYAGKREDGQLVDSDWPDIKEMLTQGRDRRSIASDYEAEPEDLDFFIQSCQRREAKQPPGEAVAPL